MAYDDMWQNVTDGVLLNKDHIIDVDLIPASTKVYGGAAWSVLTTTTLADFIAPAGTTVMLAASGTAGTVQVYAVELGYNESNNTFQDAETVHGVLLRALKYDVSQDKFYSQNPSGTDADGNKGWIEVDEAAVIVGGPLVMAGDSAASTWTATIVLGAAIL